MPELRDAFEEAYLQQFDLSGSELWVPIPLFDNAPHIGPEVVDIFNAADLPAGSKEGYRQLDLLRTHWCYHFLHDGKTGELLPGSMNCRITLTHDVEPFVSGNLLEPGFLHSCLINHAVAAEEQALENERVSAEFMDEPVPTSSGRIRQYKSSDFTELNINQRIYQRSFIGHNKGDLLSSEYHLAISPEHYLMFRLSVGGFLEEDGFGKNKQERQEFANQLTDDVMRRIRFTPSAQLLEQMQQVCAA